MGEAARAERSGEVERAGPADVALQQRRHDHRRAEFPGEGRHRSCGLETAERHRLHDEDIGRARRQNPARGRQVTHRLVGGDRHARGRADARERVDRVRRDGLLAEFDVVATELGQSLDRLDLRPRLVRVHSNPNRRSRDLTHRADAGDVLTERPATDLDLDRADTRCDRGHRPPRRPVRGQTGDRGVDRDFGERTGPAQEPGHGHVCMLRREVVKREIDRVSRARRRRDRGQPGEVGGRLEIRLPRKPDQPFRRASQRRHAGRVRLESEPGPGRGLAETDPAPFLLEEQDRADALGRGPFRARPCIGQRGAIGPNPDLSNGHPRTIPAAKRTPKRA